MYFSPGERNIGDIVKKVENGERISREEGIRLFSSYDLLALGYMANIVCQRKKIINTEIKLSKNKNITMTEKEKNLLENWLETIPTEHINGKITEAVLFYGPLDAMKITEKLIKLREMQDNYNCFQSFVPLSSIISTDSLEEKFVTGFEDLKMLAVSRIILDNFLHVKASLQSLGQKLAQVSFSFGANDVDYGDSILNFIEVLKH